MWIDRPLPSAGGAATVAPVPPDPADGRPGGPGDGGAVGDRTADDPDRALFALTDAARRDAARLARRQAAGIRAAAGASATLLGVLVDLGEHGATSVLGLGDGRTLRARVTAVAPDAVVLAEVDGTRRVVHLAHLEWVRGEPTGHPTLGDRSITVRESWPALLAELVGEATPVTVLTRSGTRLSGVIGRTGHDLLVLVTTRAGGPVTVALDAIGEVTWRGDR